MGEGGGGVSPFQIKHTPGVQSKVFLRSSAVVFMQACRVLCVTGAVYVTSANCPSTPPPPTPPPLPQPKHKDM